jgi:hypothetical protein
VILVAVLSTVLPGRRVTECENIGRRMVTKADTYVHSEFSAGRLRGEEDFVGGGITVSVSKICIQGSKVFYRIGGTSDLGHFSGWVRDRDLSE